MGSLISRFRKKPTTEEQLKKIEDGLRKIEDYKRSTERKHKKLIASIIIYSAALYILACVIVFVWYLPESWLIRLGLLIPLILVPVIVYFLKRLISKYFDSRMIKANEEYSDLQRKKKDIIDSVMETETFNKAKEILAKYAPEKLDKKEQPLPQSRLQLQTKAGADLRKRNVTQAQTHPPARPCQGPVPSQPGVTRPDLSPVRAGNAGMPPKQRLPQPVFPKERGITDKLIEFMIGDGPGYRYALICSHCRGHNGMALKEEFPYMAFNCCYCYQYNPARSKRPVPPKLPEVKELAPTTPALPAPGKQYEPGSSQVPTREETASAENDTERMEGEPDPALSRTDLKTNEESTDLESMNITEDITEDITEEKSDDDFQKLEFSESDLELLKKLQPDPSKPEEGKPEFPEDLENKDT